MDRGIDIKNDKKLTMSKFDRGIQRCRITNNWGINIPKEKKNDTRIFQRIRKDALLSA